MFHTAGNSFDKQLPDWLPMNQASFLSVGSVWNTWQIEFAAVSLGTLALLVMAAICTNGKLLDFVRFTPTQPLDRLQAWCCKVLLLWSVVAIVLVPNYVFSANFYGQCQLCIQ